MDLVLTRGFAIDAGTQQASHGGGVTWGDQEKASHREHSVHGEEHAAVNLSVNPVLSVASAGADLVDELRSQRRAGERRKLQGTCENAGSVSLSLLDPAYQ